MVSTKVGLVLFMLLLVEALPQRGLGEVKSASLRSDARPLVLFEKFGFTLRGFVNISVSDVSWKLLDHGAGRTPDPALMGFFLAREEALLQVLLEYEQGSHMCVLQNRLVKLLFTFKRLHARKNYAHLYPVLDANEYSLYFANCMPHVSVSMNVQTEMYNLEGPKNIKDYLPSGQTQLPTLHFCFSLLYLLLVCVWAYICWKNKGQVHLIHWLMGVVVLFKALNLLFKAEDEFFTKHTGSPHGWAIAFYTFSLLKGIMLFVVIALIGTGWSFLKPFLQDKDKTILMVVIPLQVIANAVNIAIDEKGPSAREWFIWKQIFIALDIICCCAVLLPIMWSIRDLKKAAQTDGKAARSLVKLMLFREYYIVLFVYVYFTRVLILALSTVANYKYLWITDLIAELTTLAFYTYTGLKFQPAPKNLYLSLDDHDEEEAAREAIKTSNFDI